MITSNAAIFYRGPSQLTGDPIVAVMTGLLLPSKNAKTGDMRQTWILHADVDPTAAIVSGADRAVCGDCSLRGEGVHGRGCYVTYWQGPHNVYRKLARRLFIDPWELRWALTKKWTRLGSYGDPVAVPVATWAALLSKAAGWVGYTQQWRTCEPAYKLFLMASCLSSVDQEEAAAAGWRTYRVRGPKDPLQPHEVICPASREADHKATCVECGLCQGTTARAAERAHAAIVAHGRLGNLKAFGIKGWTPVGRPRRIPLIPVGLHR